MKKFKKTYIEITNVCNMSCEFCPGTKRKAQFMDAGFFEDILKKIKDSSSFLYFHVMGEPLLHPQLGLFLDLAGKHGYKVNLTTNGTLVDKLYALMDKPALRQVNFSLHSNPGGGKYLSDIFTFVDESKKRTNLLIALRLWNHVAGRDGGNTKILGLIKERFCPEAELEDKPTHVRGINISKNVFLNQSERFDWPSPGNAAVNDRGFCNGLRDQIAILVDGTVVPCCLDAEGNISLGNIKQNELKDIYKSDRGRKFYNAFARKQAVEQLCMKCGYRSRFDRRMEQ
jgi:radical SAM protein with 4Fe4S-binding SPASM domain